ncbi:MAG: hypothetical protein AAGG56_02920 [Pseudomonadota bacterium]
MPRHIVPARVFRLEKRVETRLLQVIVRDTLIVTTLRAEDSARFIGLARILPQALGGRSAHQRATGLRLTPGS